MIEVLCKNCNTTLISNGAKPRSCGCSNLTTIKDDKISAVDLNQVVLINTSHKEQTNKSSFTQSELAEQEARRARKVRKLDFEIR
jgi:hypothetical protein